MSQVLICLFFDTVNRLQARVRRKIEALGNARCWNSSWWVCVDQGPGQFQTRWNLRNSDVCTWGIFGLQMAWFRPI